MKKLALIILGLSIFVAQAQKKEKIKGNREVLIKKFTIPSFNAIEVSEKFEIGLQKSTDTTRVIIETDDNLFDVIHFSVEEGVLKFNTSKEIVKKKRLKITVFVPEKFSSIKIVEKGKVYNEEAFSLKNLKIESSQRGQAKLNLDIKNDFNINLTDKSKLNFEGTAQNVNIKLGDNSEMKAKWTLKNIKIELNDHASLNQKGNVNEANIKLNQKSELNAKDFIINNAILETFDKSVAEINVKNNLSLKAKGNSEVSIFNDPKVNLKAFNDNAILYKK